MPSILCRGYDCAALEALVAGGRRLPKPDISDLIRAKACLSLTQACDRLRLELEKFGATGIWMPGLDEDAATLLKRGLLLDGWPARRIRGIAHQCHRNAAEYWARHRATALLMTGYAKSPEGRWCQHSWALDLAGPRVIVETTARRAAYFGFPLTEGEALHFCDDNGAFVADDELWEESA